MIPQMESFHVKLCSDWLNIIKVQGGFMPLHEATHIFLDLSM